MILDLGRNILRLFFLILIQVTIIRHLDLGIYFNPFLYVAGILMLPFGMDKSLVLLVAFITGLLIDMFYNTLGMNAAACIFMAYCRPWALKVYAPAGNYSSDSIATVGSMGIQWMIGYAGTLIFLHHLVLFYLEVLSFHDFFTTLAKIILSGITTLVLILVMQGIFYRKVR